MFEVAARPLYLGRADIRRLDHDRVRTAGWLWPGPGGYLDVISRVIEGLTEFLAQSADPEASNVKELTSLGVGML